jgi:hypothetical protein
VTGATPGTSTVGIDIRGCCTLKLEEFNCMYVQNAKPTPLQNRAVETIKQNEEELNLEFKSQNKKIQSMNKVIIRKIEHILKKL